jgi:hypothetical protein
MFDDTDFTPAVMSSNLFFRPSNLLDLKHIKLGDRMKVNQKTKDALLLSEGYAGKAGYADDANGEGNGHAFLYVVGVGCEVKLRKANGTGSNSTQELVCVPGCVMLAKTNDGQNSQGIYNANSYLALPFGGLTTEKVAGATVYTAGDACYLDRVPSDDDFYIGQSFETHDEHSAMISGTDLTNTVPLHINLKFMDTGGDIINPPVKQGDLLTAFLHYDAVLRIEPDGSVVSSM